MAYIEPEFQNMLGDEAQIFRNPTLSIDTTVPVQLESADGTIVGSPDASAPLSFELNGVVINGLGHIRSGQTNYNTGTGWWVGSNNGVAKLSIGNPASNYLTWDGSTLTISGTERVIQNFTATEALTQGQAVFVSDGTETRNVSQTNASSTAINMGDAGGNLLWSAQTFTAATPSLVLNQVTLSLGKNGTVGGTVIVDLYATSAGLPTGSSLATTSTSLTANTVGGQSSYNFTFNYTMTAGTVYAIVIHGITGSGAFNNIIVYGDGSGPGRSTSPDGTTWTAFPGSSFYYIVRYTFSTSGQVALTSTDSTNSPGQYASFIGFVYATTIKGSSAPVVISGSAVGLSGLTLKGQYYLQDTAGTIGTSVGSNTRKAGIAVSTTQLIITNLW